MAKEESIKRLQELAGIVGPSVGSLKVLEGLIGRSNFPQSVQSMLAAERTDRHNLAKHFDSRELFETANRAAGLSTVQTVMAAQDAERERFLRAFAPNIGSHLDFAQKLGLIAPQRFAALIERSSAIKALRLAGNLRLSEELDRYRQTDTALAFQLSQARQRHWWKDSYLEALNSHAALAGLFDESRFIGRNELAIARSVPDAACFGVRTIREARELLSLSGLLRVPRVRVLTKREKRKRLRRNVKENMPTREVRRAHSLIHSNELMIRAVLAGHLENAYGEDWPTERLPECKDCKTLLGRSRAEDETVLDGADFPHYGAIIANPQHFEDIFSKGFESPELALSLFCEVRELRKRSHHARTFTPDDLRKLIVALRAIESGLAELIEDVVPDEPYG